MQRERIASFLLFNKYKENQRGLRVQADFDHLSGVMLRSTFMDLSQKAIEQPECTDLFIGLVDIDYFKQINDNYGHRMGDWPFKG
ncbi:GGDEF domain-containing protein [Lactobacillus delbrueckii]|uniref:GGDEF domain-containing protein n=1 Tax=Lactobacillus delbrueckii TaxID=1584 RepID=UPI0022843398|nr:diguanylate cyclase [Lactobacillus delbrueckii]